MQEMNKEDLVGHRIWVRYNGVNEDGGLVTRETKDRIYIMPDGDDDEKEIYRRDINRLEITRE